MTHFYVLVILNTMFFLAYVVVRWKVQRVLPSLFLFLNASFVSIRRFHSIHLHVASSSERGLIKIICRDIKGFYHFFMAVSFGEQALISNIRNFIVNLAEIHLHALGILGDIVFLYLHNGLTICWEDTWGRLSVFGNRLHTLILTKSTLTLIVFNNGVLQIKHLLSFIVWNIGRILVQIFGVFN